MHWKRIIGIGVLPIIALLVAVYGLLATYDYNKLKPRLARIKCENERPDSLSWSDLTTKAYYW